MYRLKEMPPVRGMDFIFGPAQALRAALPEPINRLYVRGAIFRTINDKSYLLVLKRASSDSLPNCWELPGGGVDDNDSSIKDALHREIKEETGLTATWTVQEVGHGQRWRSDNGRRIFTGLFLTFVVEAEEVELLDRAGGEEDKADTTRSAPNYSAAKTYSSANADSNDLYAVPVKLAESEHQRYLWVSEDEIANKCGGGGLESLVFTSDDTQQVMLQAFEVQKQVIHARKMI